MMRRFGLAVLLALAMQAAASAHASGTPRPAEEPPADFAGRQYIDSSGCVFLRDGRQWTARSGRDGAPVCGYPPTPVGRGAAPGVLADDPPPLDGMGRIEAELVTAITANMAPGDWVGAPPAPPRRVSGASDPAAATVGADVAGVMAAAVAASAAIGSTVSGGASAAGPNDNARLCGLLGIAPGNPAHVLGGDPTGGMCSGLAGPGLSPRIARVESAAARAASRDDAAPAGAAVPAPARAAAAGGKRIVASSAAERRPTTSDRVTQSPASLAGMIPAGTRFLAIGSYDDPAAADAALRRVAALGLPLARSRGAEGSGARTILAGPFQTRQAVVRAHDRLTRAGFRGLVPRR